MDDKNHPNSGTNKGAEFDKDFLGEESHSHPRFETSLTGSFNSAVKLDETLIKALSALLGLDSPPRRSLGDPLSKRDPHQWLSRYFNEVDVVQSGSRFVAALPSVYRAKNLMSRAEQREAEMAEMLGIPSMARYRFSTERMEATADSRNESLGMLCKALFDTKYITIYSPKPGQDPSIVVPGREYFCIKQQDPLHDHASTDLIDFRLVVVDPYSDTVEGGPFITHHSHLIDSKLAL